MCSQGEQCQALPLVLSGNARVFTEGENGREITLYRVFPGETCVLAISCILSGRPSPAFTMAETDGEVLALPGEVFRGWFERSQFWRTYVFAQLAERLVDVIAITNEAVFRRLDCRIASYLLEAPADPRSGIRVTHQDLAAELGSSREVVSRILKSFEHAGLVRLGRGRIRLADRQGLSAKARPFEDGPPSPFLFSTQPTNL